MDPRIRRRRMEVRREEGRHRLRVLVGVTAVAALAGSGWATTRSALLDVDRIVVRGAVRTPVDEVVAAAHLRRGQPLVDVDPGSAARAVDGLAWVGHASVERRWPGRVTILVQERAPVAVAPADLGGMAVVDATGRVLDRVDVAPAGLAVLAGTAPAGPPGSWLSPAGVAAVSVAVALPAELRARTAGIGPPDPGPAPGPTADPAVEVELRLAPEGTVRLGRPEDLVAKFDAVRAVLASVDLHNLAVLDVRRPDSPVLTRRDAPTKVSTPRAG